MRKNVLPLVGIENNSYFCSLETIVTRSVCLKFLDFTDFHFSSTVENMNLCMYM